jgi:ribosomal protein S20
MNWHEPNRLEHTKTREPKDLTMRRRENQSIRSKMRTQLQEIKRKIKKNTTGAGRKTRIHGEQI